MTVTHNECSNPEMVGSIRPFEFNEEDISEKLSNLSLKEIYMQTFTATEFYNWGLSCYEAHDFADWERKWT